MDLSISKVHKVLAHHKSVNYTTVHQHRSTGRSNLKFMYAHSQSTCIDALRCVYNQAWQFMQCMSMRALSHALASMHCALIFMYCVSVPAHALTLMP